jgi:hypothetical protein
VKLDAGATRGAYVVTKGPGNVVDTRKALDTFAREHEGKSASRNGPHCKVQENQLR